MSTSTSPADGLRALVVDDEGLACRGLRRKLLASGGVTEVDVTTNPAEAVARLRDAPPDVVFLDVQMPGLTGFDVLAQFPETNRPFAVVFCTAHDTHATRAFEAAALDYLVKPVDPARLAAALARVRRHLRPDASRDELARARAARLVGWLNRLVVRTRSGVAIVPLSDVLAIASEAHRAVAYTRSEEHVLEPSLAALEPQLDPARFARSHRATSSGWRTSRRSKGRRSPSPEGGEFRCRAGIGPHSSPRCISADDPAIDSRRRRALSISPRHRRRSSSASTCVPMLGTQGDRRSMASMCAISRSSMTYRPGDPGRDRSARHGSARGIIGTAEVRDVFRSSKFGAIAGCMVIEGVGQAHKPIRVLRDNTVIFEGELESLRRFKEHVDEVRNGMECGIGVKQYNDVKPGDQIECFERIEVATDAVESRYCGMGNRELGRARSALPESSRSRSQSRLPMPSEIFNRTDRISCRAAQGTRAARACGRARSRVAVGERVRCRGHARSRFRDGLRDRVAAPTGSKAVKALNEMADRVPARAVGHVEACVACRSCVSATTIRWTRVSASSRCCARSRTARG